jgi:hypothetical protein
MAAQGGSSATNAQNGKNDPSIEQRLSVVENLSGQDSSSGLTPPGQRDHQARPAGFDLN